MCTPPWEKPPPTPIGPNSSARLLPTPAFSRNILSMSVCPKQEQIYLIRGRTGWQFTNHLKLLTPHTADELELRPKLRKDGPRGGNQNHERKQVTWQREQTDKFQFMGKCQTPSPRHKGSRLRTGSHRKIPANGQGKYSQRFTCEARTNVKIGIKTVKSERHREEINK